MQASQKSKRKKAKANRTLGYVSSTLSMATHSLVKMVAITALSGAVLLALLALPGSFETCRIRLRAAARAWFGPNFRWPGGGREQSVKDTARGAAAKTACAPDLGASLRL